MWKINRSCSYFRYCYGSLKLLRLQLDGWLVCIIKTMIFFFSGRRKRNFGIGQRCKSTPPECSLRQANRSDISCVTVWVLAPASPKGEKLFAMLRAGRILPPGNQGRQRTFLRLQKNIDSVLEPIPLAYHESCNVPAPYSLTSATSADSGRSWT